MSTRRVKPIWLEALENDMRALINGDDPEDAHAQADDIVCQALERLSAGDLVELWKEVPKWYA